VQNDAEPAPAHVPQRMSKACQTFFQFFYFPLGALWCPLVPSGALWCPLVPSCAAMGSHLNILTNGLSVSKQTGVARGLLSSLGQIVSPLAPPLDTSTPPFSAPLPPNAILHAAPQNRSLHPGPNPRAAQPNPPTFFPSPSQPLSKPGFPASQHPGFSLIALAQPQPANPHRIEMNVAGHLHRRFIPLDDHRLCRPRPVAAFLNFLTILSLSPAAAGL
jgi:hypothetical protein